MFLQLLLQWEAVIRVKIIWMLLMTESEKNSKYFNWLILRWKRVIEQNLKNKFKFSKMFKNDSFFFYLFILNFCIELIYWSQIVLNFQRNNMIFIIQEHNKICFEVKPQTNVDFWWCTTYKYIKYNNCNDISFSFSVFDHYTLKFQMNIYTNNNNNHVHTRKTIQGLLLQNK